MSLYRDGLTAKLMCNTYGLISAIYRVRDRDVVTIGSLRLEPPMSATKLHKRPLPPCVIRPHTRQLRPSNHNDIRYIGSYVYQYRQRTVNQTNANCNRKRMV